MKRRAISVRRLEVIIKRGAKQTLQNYEYTIR
jgi:hypothetical protein